MVDMEDLGSQGSGKRYSASIYAKAGLHFPVKKFTHLMLARKNAKHLNVNIPIFLSATLQYIAAEVLELAGNAARDEKMNVIVPQHIHNVVRNDDELNKLLGEVLEMPENAPENILEGLGIMFGQITI